MTLTEMRRALHQIPELVDDLPETAGFVRAQLAGLGCQITEVYPCALCAYFDFGREETVAFRADMDALPIQEQTGAEFASRHPGIMHACGHDGHMAMVLGLGQWLARQRTLPRNVLLIFQPAEETTGGAKRIVDSGIFERYHVTRVFGQHLWPELPVGTIGCRPGPMMSRASEVDIVVTGRSAHAAKAALGLDAMAAACQVLERAGALEQTLPEEVFRLLHFGRMEAGTVRNAVAARAVLQGTLRAFEDQWFQTLLEGLEAVCREVADQTGCEVRLLHNEGYPAVCNDPALYRLVKKQIPLTELPEPSMISEDFSYYGRRVPGVFFFLGCGPAPSLHAADFCFDESVLETGCQLFQQLAGME